ncbi:hypothetical protein SM11_pC1247 (plasmid) [Sinorhizobium meliloti SM11]|uniref:Uncharacterized protein n=1 Tax=Sinorhizobium meliloti (strain SM11) TaxID=707241 RepID=F7XCA2_SINMM|nr:hypothetical protein SM11_pC0320 [Sinorhizobium meliloti SM11]AEH82320.1 hypothetical protein SM11_pC1247 [Sinorhizobium meliloti SM11]
MQDFAFGCSAIRSDFARQTADNVRFFHLAHRL